MNNDIDFIQTDSSLIFEELINDFEFYTKQKLNPGDPRREFLCGFGYALIGILNSINVSARATLLRFAFKDRLDAIAELSKTKRLDATHSSVKMKFNTQGIQTFDITIPSGTRVTPDGILFFLTESDLIITSGQTFGEVNSIAQNAGRDYNNFSIGQINKLVDGIPFISSVANTTISSGGSDVESDDDFRERLRTSPYSLTTAGSEMAYKSVALQSSPLVGDVSISSPSPGQVKLIVICKDGVIPTADSSVITAVKNACSDREVKPLTDEVIVIPATADNTTINFSYYISKNDLSSKSTIEFKINSAVSDYKKWQCSKMGRNINPDELKKLVLNAGAAKVDITSPIYKEVADNCVAQITTTTINYVSEIDV